MKERGRCVDAVDADRRRGVGPTGVKPTAGSSSGGRPPGRGGGEVRICCIIQTATEERKHDLNSAGGFFDNKNKNDFSF